MKTPFESVLVANRGEIAVRVIRTVQAMGMRAIAVYTDVDRGARMSRSPTRPWRSVAARVPVGRADRRRRAGVRRRRLHPGYGFLSENPTLARACAAAA